MAKYLEPGLVLSDDTRLYWSRVDSDPDLEVLPVIIILLLELVNNLDSTHSCPRVVNPTDKLGVDILLE